MLPLKWCTRHPGSRSLSLIGQAARGQRKGGGLKFGVVMFKPF